ncbi:type VI secretion system-associated protein TagF [Plastoroseomonas hellenica]|uniref:type VI secretion system-associated protein TagF n=1 Tax=Plastoroseomonas hellenica TaxID=2687306 RepID=UPI001BAB7970|nr:type VI secretion system-associated protein TagF [Plastoroseomonas hellenica]MBR0645949.1 type VI secretion system-associated protein TagF [Plastoroseomonas hellenica]
MPGPGSELSGGPVAIGLYGKMPAHGDFVRRALPGSFVAPWDAWLAAGIAAARDRLGDEFAAVWDMAPAWRFALPAGTCGPDAVAGVMLPSADTVGRRFPLTVAALLPRGRAPDEGWFAGIEARAREAREGILDADALTRALSVAGDGVLPPTLPEETLLGLFGTPAEPGEPAALEGADAGTTAAEIPAEAWLDLFSGEEQAEAAPAAPDPPEGATAAQPVEAWLNLLGGEGVAETNATTPPSGTDTPPAEAWLDLLGGSGQGDAAPSARDDPAPASGTDTPPAEPPPAAWLDLLGSEGEDSDRKDTKPLAAEALDAGAWDALLDVPPSGPAAEDISLALFGETPPPSDVPPPDVVAALPAPDPAVPPTPSDAEAAPDEDAPFIEPPTPQAPARPGVAEAAPMPDPDAASTPAGPEEPPAADAMAHTPVPPPERPDQGGWWTLGGGRLPAMVWAFPALPPPEAFVLLLETEA